MCTYIQYTLYIILYLQNILGGLLIAIFFCSGDGELSIIFALSLRYFKFSVPDKSLDSWAILALYFACSYVSKQNKCKWYYIVSKYIVS